MLPGTVTLKRSTGRPSDSHKDVEAIPSSFWRQTDKKSYATWRGIEASCSGTPARNWCTRSGNRSNSLSEICGMVYCFSSALSFTG